MQPKPVLIASLLFTGPALAQKATDVIEVVGRTPLGANQDIDQVASNAQLVTAEMLRAKRPLDLSDFMKRTLASVFVNEAQNNPLQPDVQYRGFVGSPLLGLPQGIAVYQDGVRINEPFGDTVNWALIPESAINTVYLIPGSNPLFGLNALGGSITIETKNGFSAPGTRAEVYGGSFGRVALQAETGGSNDDGFGYFLTGSYLEEDGWRDFSPTAAKQVFGNLGWQSVSTTISLNVTLADTDLIGNGAAPVELLDTDREAIFTWPDQTENELTLINLLAETSLSDSLTLTGNVYVRRSDISTYNGDDSDFEECEDYPGFICEEDDDEGELVADQNDNRIPASDEVEGATINRTNTEQGSVGIEIQAAWKGDLGSRENVFVVGMAYDKSDIEFDASTELGALDSTRQAIPGGVFVGESFTRLAVDTSIASLYFSNTLSLTDAIGLTVSGRYHDTDVTLRDGLGVALNGDHNFARFNPAVGLTVGLNGRLTLYASYSQSNRVPSPVELTCADEDDPCRLPNAFLADPPLKQVVAETFETGVRGRWKAGGWHAGIFRTTNKDDILFISAGALTNEGFFDNVGRTRRDGFELNVNGQSVADLTWSINYTFLDATFRETLAFPSPHNPGAIDGEVNVTPGDRLPLIARHLFKGGLHKQIGDRMTIGGEVVASSGFHMRGDEGNDLATIGGYEFLNLRFDYRVNKNVEVFLNIDNVFDEEYATFGLLGEADEALGGDFEDSRFFSPSAPRGGWVGLQVEFD